VQATSLDGVILVEPEVYRDDRGFFLESYNKRRFAELGIRDEFVQDNHSLSVLGVLRGIHYQDMSAPMSKLVRCTRGGILDVAVDLRVGSPTFSRWTSVELTAENMRQLFVPVGFGHAFLTLSETAEVQYKCGGFYQPAAEASIAWNDPEIGVEWPNANPILSAKDSRGMSLAEYRARPAFHHPVRA
jgi:dTDP-4-dehydrorhamnose 3,5-epimerase